MSLVYMKRRLRMRAARTGAAALGFMTRHAIRALRVLDHRRMGRLTSAVARTIGPWTKEQRVARAQLTAAFPEKTPAEIETILRGVWDNLGRFVAEFAQIDRITTRDPEAASADYDIDYEPESRERFEALRSSGKPALIFSAHLANWELSAQVAAAYKLDTAILFRRPNVGPVADAVLELRTGTMGTLVQTGLDAPLRLAQALEAGRHVAILVDQYSLRGVDVTFFGRRTKANPLLARLARQVDVPIHGARVVRLPGGGFRCDLTEAITPVRDAEGRVEVAGTMQVITSVVEGWVREHPDQWLWLHRRWRES